MFEEYWKNNFTSSLQPPRPFDQTKQGAKDEGAAHEFHTAETPRTEELERRTKVPGTEGICDSVQELNHPSTTKSPCF